MDEIFQEIEELRKTVKRMEMLASALSLGGLTDELHGYATDVRHSVNAIDAAARRECERRRK